MIISRTQVQNLLKVYELNNTTSPNAKTEAVTNARKADEVDISDQSKLKQRILKNISKVSPMRGERVEQLKDQFNKGVYEIKGDKVAEEMIYRLLTDELV
ncbi:MAG: flagellar biosynthesis anti-sigma factor FlgM [Syntrophomonadaceae bacterium]|jgi:negative regulator of flagellin synthesis FlgM|nr:flagellar biosynthesis anti-sigma factor FlgM [Syntrophomonadaceae bacterium]